MSNNGLIVRRTERFEISLPARVRVSAMHLELVQFAKGVAGDDRWMEIDVVDFAQGGIGFVSDVFFARGLELEVEIPNSESSGEGVMVRGEIQVKRVQMTDRRPAYLVGCAFVGMDGVIEKQIEDLIDRLRGEIDGDQFEGGAHA